MSFDCTLPWFPSQKHHGGSLGDFVVDWDAPQSQDVVLRRRNGLGEEIAVSALLGPPHHEENDSLPRHALMKVCITKPSLSNVLQFDCGIFGQGVSSSTFEILSAYYLRSPDCTGASVYRGPLYRSDWVISYIVTFFISIVAFFFFSFLLNYVVVAFSFLVS